MASAAEPYRPVFSASPFPVSTPTGGANPARPPSRRRAKQPAPTAVEGGGAVRDIILVGCGAFAQQAYVPTLQTLQQSGQVAVRAIVETSESAREWCRNQFPQVAPLASFETVVAPPDALVIISTPARFHAQQAGAAFKRGWHVLCANPFATTAREGAAMIAAADRNERLLAVDLPQRFTSAARTLRTLCRDHLLGPAISFRIHEGTTRPAREMSMPGGEKFESPDGVLNELGLPALDLLAWCFGRAAVKTYADDAMGGVEANAHIELNFAEGVHGTIHLSCDWPTEQSYTFVFERGIVRWRAREPNRLTLHLASTPFALEGDLIAPLSTNPPHVTPGHAPTPEDPAAAQLHNILGAIAGREPLRASAAEAMPALSLVEECYGRRTQLTQPWLSQSEAVQARASAPPMALRRP